MDGHEHEDVIKYCQEVFLPGVELLERRMTQYDGPALEIVKPTLNPGEKEVLTYFHDECCFHANDEARNLWYVISKHSFVQD